MNRGASRVFIESCVWSVDYSAVVSAARMLATGEAAQDHDVVVAVARGGLVPAAVVAAELRLPMFPIAVRHNTTEDVRVPATHAISIDSDLSHAVALGARILVVDDISGSGATLAHVATALSGLTSRPFRCVTLCRNVGTAYVPDAWVWDVADWVSFPWEPPPPEHLGIRPLMLPTRTKEAS